MGYDYLLDETFCDGCGKKLQPVCPSDNNHFQMKDALLIYLVGGYGMAIDNTGPFEHDVCVIICLDCVEKARNEVTWFWSAMLNDDDWWNKHYGE
jgi:hypothetical protein